MVRLGGQGGCEQRIEVFVRGGGGSVGGRGQGGRLRGQGGCVQKN